jgi:DnaJ like chaperone protein
MYWVKQLVKEARDNATDLSQLLDEFRTSFAYEPRLILLELIYQIIYTKQPPPDNELRLAREIAGVLQISVYDQRTIEAKYMYRQRQEAATSGQMEEQYYAVLGLEKGADFAK